MILGDSGMFPQYTARRIHMVKYYHRLLSLPEDRLLKQVFMHEINSNGPWAKDVKSIFGPELGHLFGEDVPKHELLGLISNQLFRNFHATWTTELLSSSKLDVYSTIKFNIELETYISCTFLSRYQRRLYASCRAGVLPLEIERGRWRGTPKELRLCKQCTMNVIEDLEHFLLVCPKYSTLRTEFLMNINIYPVTISSILCNHLIIKNVSQYICNLWHSRSES